MPDKRTTSDPAEGAPRRKRRAPTIDLTATEVPEATTARAHPEPSGPPGPEQVKPADESETRSESKPESIGHANSSSGRASWLSGPALAGGITGATVAVIAFLALWLAGAAPVRHAVSTEPSAQLDVLAQRIAKVEAALAKIPANDPSVSERLSAADNAMKSLGIALTALNKHNEEAAAGAADARARADAAEKSVAQLRGSLQDLTRNTSAGVSPVDVDALQKRIAALEQTTKSAPVDVGARLAQTVTALRDAVVSGVPFVAELDAARSLGVDENTLKLLTPFAANGVPTAAALGQELSALIPAMSKAAGSQGPGGSLLERIEANASKLVRIRPVGAPAGTDPSAVLARIEVEAAHADIDGALTDLARLDAAIRSPAQTWIDKARARQAALTAARQLVGDATRALGKR
ncbi:MAG TPA: hypothetical protein VIY07_19405 [Pseudolabrys sp.]